MSENDRPNPWVDPLYDHPTPRPDVPSKPLTPTELDELRRDHRIGGPHPGSNLTVCTKQDGPHIGRCDVARLLATLDATQAVEPSLREAFISNLATPCCGGSEWHDEAEAARTKENAIAAFDRALAARSSSAPAELEALREALWRCGVESGMDTDGDTGPGAMVAGMGDAGFAAAIVEHVRQLRGAYDECLAEPAARLTSSPENPA
jgi:hypothetical protein